MFKPISTQCESQAPGKDSSSGSGGKLYHVWRDLEDNYRKNFSQDESAVRPRFYTLTPAETNTQDTPKLDGLVRALYCSGNFINFEREIQGFLISPESEFRDFYFVSA